MKNHKIYEPDDKLISIIKDNYNTLQSLGSFGINLGFGDKTVKEVCESQGVDTYTFLAVINFTINGKEFEEKVLNVSEARPREERAPRRNFGGYHNHRGGYGEGRGNYGNNDRY